MKKVFYNPQSGGPELYLQNTEMPALNPLWEDEATHAKGTQPAYDLKERIHDYLNKQELRVAYEIEPNTCKKPQS